MHRSLAEPDVLLEAFTAGRSASLARANTPEAWFTCGRLVAFLFLYLLAAYPEVILGSHTFFHRDFGVYGYPVAHHFRECFWRGELPLWNPLSDSGQPF